MAMFKRLTLYALERPSFLGEFIYLKYLRAIGAVLRILGNKSSLRNVERAEIEGIFRASFYDGNDFYFVGWKRASRYAKGIEHAGRRLQKQYMLTWQKVSPQVFIDVGANVGELSVLFCSENSLVYSFEPDPLNFIALQKNVSKFDNIKTFNHALSDSESIKEFYLKPESADSSLHFVNGASIIPVITKKLDDVIEPKVTLGREVWLKMDAEGHEPEVIRGAIRVMRQITRLSIDAGAEREGEVTHPECTKLLSKLFELKLYDNNILHGRRLQRY
jgi:FkbM family methyltransferase